MDEWELIFGKVQSLSRSVSSVQEGLNEIVAFARGNSEVFDEPEYWTKAANHNFHPAVSTVRSWAANGLESLTPKSGWEFLLLDLGDCPETFRFYSPGGQDLMDESKFRKLILHNLLICDGLEKCFIEKTNNLFDILFGSQRKEHLEHHVSELDDTLLDWTDDEEMDFHHWNGYLLWLSLGSLALADSLRDANYCKQILRERERIYLLVGYEEIFFYLATVTPTGLKFEEASK